MIDIHHPESPNLLFSKSFDAREGTPRSVSFCFNQAGHGEVAVALSSYSQTLEGHVIFYQAHQRGSGAKDLSLDGYTTGTCITYSLHARIQKVFFRGGPSFFYVLLVE